MPLKSSFTKRSGLRSVIHTASSLTMRSSGSEKPGPRVDELDLLRIGRRAEHVDAAARAIEREDAALGPDRHGVHAVELSRPVPVAAELRRGRCRSLSKIITRWLSRPSAMRMRPSGRNATSCGLAKCVASAAGDALLAERLQQLLAVVREHVDLVERLVDHPDAALGIVGADAEPVRARAVRPFAQRVPLRPSFLDLAVAIQGVEAVLPHAAIGQRQHVHLERAGEAGELGRHRRRQPELAALRDEDAVRRLGEHARSCRRRRSPARRTACASRGRRRRGSARSGPGSTDWAPGDDDATTRASRAGSQTTRIMAGDLTSCRAAAAASSAR